MYIRYMISEIEVAISRVGKNVLPVHEEVP